MRSPLDRLRVTLELGTKVHDRLKPNDVKMTDKLHPCLHERINLLDLRKTTPGMYGAANE